jgi:CheY-like chemotaxis protein
MGVGSVRASVLVVDDDPIQCAIIREALSGLTCDCSEACDGFAALARMADAPADLVIVDMLMPGKDGVETILAINKRWPGTRIVAISGGSAGLAKDYLLDTAKALGAHAAMRKPIVRTELLAVVGDLLADCVAERGRD